MTIRTPQWWGAPEWLSEHLNDGVPLNDCQNTWLCIQPAPSNWTPQFQLCNFLQLGVPATLWLPDTTVNTEWLLWLSQPCPPFLHRCQVSSCIRNSTRCTLLQLGARLATEAPPSYLTYWQINYSMIPACCRPCPGNPQIVKGLNGDWPCHLSSDDGLHLYIFSSM